METHPNKEMTLTRVFAAPKELVWDVWTQPEYFSEWFGFPLKTPVERIAMDLRPGGEWKAVMLTTDGKELPFTGHYEDVLPPDRLVMTFENVDDPSDVNTEVLTVTLRDVEGKTEVTIHQAGHMPDEQYPKLVEGYTNFMNGMEKLLKKLLATA